MEILLHIWYFLTLMLCSTISKPNNCPSACSCSLNLKNVTCRNQSLNDIPENLNSEVLILDLAYNEFETIPSKLKHYKYLEEINLSHNKIAALGSTSMTGLYNLKCLDLSFNLFKEWKDIHPHTFSLSIKLSKLNLSHNSLKNFPDIADNYLTSSTIEILDISSCLIDNINGDIMQGMPALKKLVLSDNKIAFLNAQLRSPKLETLVLENCGIQKIAQDAFAFLKSLKSLYVGNNYGLEEFNVTSTSLKLLDLTNCALMTIPQCALPNLTEISLRGNRLRHLPNNSFTNFPLLKMLDLSHNAISQVGTEAFKDLDEVETIKLHYNTITHLGSDTFNTNFHLKKLYLSHNYLTQMPQFDIESLKMLDLNECEISSFSKNSLANMPVLDYLDISNNFITEIPDNTEAENLQTLHIRNCKIVKITKYTFQKMPKLKYVNLIGNRLTTHFNISYLYYIQDILLNDNLWVCECNSSSFYFFNDKLKNIAQDYHQLKCHSPEYLRGQTWELACYQVWYENKYTSSWAVAIGILIAALIMMCVVFSMRRAFHLRKEQRRQDEQLEREEATRQRLRQMRLENQQYRISENRNAPDPRELQTPPSYEEALLMPRSNTSVPDLSGSRKDIFGSRTSIRSEDDSGGRRRRRRKRRRSRTKPTSSSDSEQQSSIVKCNSEEQSKERCSRYSSTDSDQQNALSDQNNFREQKPNGEMRNYMESDI